MAFRTTKKAAVSAHLAPTTVTCVINLRCILTMYYVIPNPNVSAGVVNGEDLKSSGFRLTSSNLVAVEKILF
jgi:hypothetical protein